MRRRDFLGLSVGSLLIASLMRESAVRAQGAPARWSTARQVGCAVSPSTAPVAFKGIRNGASTAGANRFHPPAKPQPWSGIVDVFEYGPRAWQPFRTMIPEIFYDGTELARKHGSWW